MSLSDFTPRAKQQEVISQIRRHTFWEAHRREGKTYTLSWLVVRQLILPIPDRTILYVAPYLKQVRATVWPYLQYWLHSHPDIQLKSSEHLILNKKTNSRIILSGMMDNTADSLRGLGAHFGVADELSGYSHDDFHSILLPIFAETRGILILTGTPPPTFDLFLEQKNWHKQQAITDPDNYAFFSHPVTETDVFTPKEIEQLKKQSPSSFQREYMLDTSSGDETSFVPLSLLEKCTARNPQNWEPEPDASPICGWDVALKRDASAYTIRLDNEILAMGRLSGKPSEQVSTLYSIMREHVCSVLCYDVGGLGHAFEEPLDALTQRDIYLDCYEVNFNGRPSDPRKFANSRSEMYYNLQSWLHLPSSCLPTAQHPTPTLAEHAPTLLEDVAAQMLRPNDKNLFALEKKDKIKKAIGRSPDFSDAFALTFYPVDPPDPYTPDPHNESRIAARYIHGA